MKRSFWNLFGAALAALCLLTAAVHAQPEPEPEANRTSRRDAQRAAASSTTQTRTLHIADGRIVIDGRPVDAAAVPADLTLDGVQASFSWVGIERPVVQLGAGFYAVEADRLVAEPEFWLNQLRQAPPEPLQKIVPMERFNGVIFDTERGQAYSLAGRPLPEAEAKQELQRGTDNLYLNDLQSGNQSLFHQLTTERRMEMQALRLAEEIRTTPEADGRAALQHELSALLDDVFELKNRNRLAEIRQLEAQLDRLRAALAERERLKAQMIEARIRQLVGPDP